MRSLTSNAQRTPEELWDRVLQLYPNWRLNLEDGKRIDYILEEVNKAALANKSTSQLCAHGNCTNRVTGSGRYCYDCKVKAAEYMKQYRKRKAASA